MVEIFEREVLSNRIVYKVHCNDGKDRMVTIMLYAPHKDVVAPRFTTWVTILKDGKEFGASSSVNPKNKKIWGDGFLDKIVADLDAEFPEGYQEAR